MASISTTVVLMSVFNALHREAGTSPAWRRLLRLVLGFHVVSEGAEDVVTIWIDAAQLLVHSGDLVCQVVVLVLSSASNFKVGTELAILLLSNVKRSLESINVVNGYDIGQYCVCTWRPRRMDKPLLSTSHLLDLFPGELGRTRFKVSNRSFISLLRLRSANL